MTKLFNLRIKKIVFLQSFKIEMMNLYKIDSDFSAFSLKTGIRGDYAHILWNGWAIKQENQIFLERFGEATPPIYVSFGCMIVTDEVKQKLSASDLCGFEFYPAKKQKIIQGDWQNFDFEFFEEFDDPTYDPIEYGEHCEATAQKMPAMWYLKGTDLPFKRVEKDKFEFEPNPNADFFHATEDRRGVFVSEKAKKWLEKENLPLKFDFLV